MNRVGTRRVRETETKRKRVSEGRVNISQWESASIVFAWCNELIYLFSPAKKCTQGNEKLGPVLDSENKPPPSPASDKFSRDNARLNSVVNSCAGCREAQKFRHETPRILSSLRPARGFARGRWYYAILDSNRARFVDVLFPQSILFSQNDMHILESGKNKMRLSKDYLN